MTRIREEEELVLHTKLQFSEGRIPFQFHKKYKHLSLPAVELEMGHDADRQQMGC